MALRVDRFLALKEDKKYKQIASETWFDWFGSTDSLVNKSKRASAVSERIIKKFLSEDEYDEWEVLFKENAPLGGTGFIHTGWVRQISGDRVYWFSYPTGSSGRSFVSGTHHEYDIAGDTLGVAK